MKIFDTVTLTEQSMKQLSPNEAAWAYNGLDVCVTAEIYTELQSQIDSDEPNISETYQMALSKLAPIMEMSLRGTRIDEHARLSTLKELRALRDQLNEAFQYLIKEIFDIEMNYRSPLQLKNFFYGMLKLKEVKKRNQKGFYTATTGREALESFDKYIHAKVFSRFILVLRDLEKQIGFLKSELDSDNRIRCNYNIAGTNTGRLSSSMNDFGTGTNLQNVNRKLRFPFSADPGMYLVNVDLEQADGRNVGATCWNLFIDSHGEEFAGAYLNACEDGDLHTTVCKMVWPDALKGEPWPEDPAEWKKFCDSIIAHGQDSYRQLSKKGGHGTNYYGTPRTMGKHLHMPTKIIDEFQKNYFGTFPAIPAWHEYVIQQIADFGSLTTLFGRRRMFFGRGNDASTHRAAIAYGPQSMTGEQIDRGLLQVWRAHPEVQLLNQVHDSILFQIPFEMAEELIPRILKTMQVTLELKRGRLFTIPLDAAGGWNWGYADKTNPWGLKAWTGSETREAPFQRRSLKQSIKAGLTL